MTFIAPGKPSWINEQVRFYVLRSQHSSEQLRLRASPDTHCPYMYIVRTYIHCVAKGMFTSMN